MASSLLHDVNNQLILVEAKIPSREVMDTGMKTRHLLKGPAAAPDMPSLVLLAPAPPSIMLL